jgi:hypothetical protein
MIQAVPLPIVRSSKLYTEHRVFVDIFLLLTTKMSEFQQLTHNSGMLYVQSELLMMGGGTARNM